MLWQTTVVAALVLGMAVSASAQNSALNHRHTELHFSFDIDYGGTLYPVSLRYITSQIAGKKEAAGAPFVTERINQEVTAEKLPFSLVFGPNMGWTGSYSGKPAFAPRPPNMAGVKGAKDGPFYFSNDFRWFDIVFCPPQPDDCTKYKPSFGDEPTAFLYKNLPDGIEADRPNNADEGYFEYIDFSFQVSADIAQAYLGGERTHEFSFRNLKLVAVLAPEGNHPEEEPAYKEWQKHRKRLKPN